MLKCEECADISYDTRSHRKAFSLAPSKSPTRPLLSERYTAALFHGTEKGSPTRYEVRLQLPMKKTIFRHFHIVAGILYSIHQICPKLSCKIFHQDIPSHPPMFCIFCTYFIQSSTEVLLWCTHFGSPFWCLSALAALFQSGPWQHNRVTYFFYFFSAKGRFVKPHKTQPIHSIHGFDDLGCPKDSR